MATEATFEPLGSTDRQAFEDFFRIYAESIPRVEQKPRAALEALVSRPDYEILLARKDGAVAGFSVTFRSAEEPFSLLEYMAVDHQHRSANVGAALFQRSLRDLPMLLEVDSASSAAPDLAIRQRRVRFYRRLGCLRVEGLSYLLPLPGAVPPPEMDLMVHLPPEVRRIPRAQLERWLSVIYRDVYDRSPEDPRIGRMIESIADPVALL